MPRIQPIAWDELDHDIRRRIEAGMASGMYSTPVPLQVVAHSPPALRAMDDSYRALFRAGLLDQRIQELVRLRSAQLGSCEPCSASRKDESITDDDVACLVDPGASGFTDRERLALRFVDLLATDHLALDAAFYRELGQVFSPGEVVELGWFVGQMIGVHRFMHTLDFAGTDEPVVALPA